MSAKTFVRRSRISAPVEDLLRWHGRDGAFRRLTPPWERVEMLEHSGGIEPGARLVLRTRLGPIWKRWVAEHEALPEGVGFRDVQVSGPFARWEHEHRFEPSGPRASTLEDHIVYALPAAPLSHFFGGWFVRRSLERMFAYRHRITELDLRRHMQAATAEPSTAKKTLRVVVTGASGLVGSALTDFLSTGGHDVVRMVRREARGPKEIQWSTEPFEVRADELEGADAVVHLAGENIAARRWSDAQKERIRGSRVDVTARLCETLAKLERPPQTFVCASATGFYGDRGAEVLDESSAPGTGFLADTCQAWEAAAQPLAGSATRVVHARFGVILSPAGGALAKMLTPFKLGGGGPVGSGDQYMSWIALDDVVGALHHMLQDSTLSGPANVVSPEPVTNREFARTLGRVLSRPAILPMPAFAARLAFGEMADELLLSGARVMPTALTRAGFEPEYPRLEAALRHMLGR